MIRRDGPGWCDGEPSRCTTARAAGKGRRCWTCPARDLEIDLATPKGKALRRAIEIDGDLSRGRTLEAGSLPCDVEAAWRIVVEAREHREAQLQDEAERKAKRR